MIRWFTTIKIILKIHQFRVIQTYHKKMQIKQVQTVRWTWVYPWPSGWVTPVTIRKFLCFQCSLVFSLYWTYDNGFYFILQGKQDLPVMVRGMGLRKICKPISDSRICSLQQINLLKLALGPKCPNFHVLIDQWNGRVYPQFLLLSQPISLRSIPALMIRNKNYIVLLF